MHAAFAVAFAVAGASGACGELAMMPASDAYAFSFVNLSVLPLPLQALQEIVSRGADPANIRVVAVVAAPPALKLMADAYPGEHMVYALYTCHLWWTQTITCSKSVAVVAAPPALKLMADAYAGEHMAGLKAT
jgi:hypothetical protein